MALATDDNGEDAAQHIRNALQILSFAEKTVVSTRNPRDNGTVRLTAEEATGLESRLRKALKLLQ